MAKRAKAAVSRTEGASAPGSTGRDGAGGDGTARQGRGRAAKPQAAAPAQPLDAERALDVLNAMAEGAVLWDAEGRCLMCNPRALALLELEPGDLEPGTPREAFMMQSIATGAMTPEGADDVMQRFEAGKAFSFERTTPTGRELRANARPCRGGGYVVTLSDVSDLRVQELIVAKAKEKAEKAQADLAERLDDLTMEKKELEAQRAELERTALVATHASDLVYITNPQGRLEWINRAFAMRTGYSIKDVADKRPLDVLSGDDTNEEEVERLNAGFKERRTTRAELQVYARDGSSFWFKCELIPIFSKDGRNTHFISVGRDVTERRAAWKKAEQARLFEQRKREESHLLTDFNEWLQSCDTVEEMFDVVRTFLSRLLPQCKGSVYVYADTRDVLDGICNWNDGPMLGSFEPGDCWGLRRGRPYVYGENAIAFPCAHAAEQYDGEVPARYCCVPITAHGDTVGLLHVEIPRMDLEERVFSEDELRETQKLINICAEQISLAIANLKLREQLRNQSIRDVLTGLYNRRYFLDTARRELNRATSSGESLSIISFDVDKFKVFNDTHGHDAGDAVLRTLSSTMTQMFTGRDIPCRFGGEEFIVLLPGADAAKVAERAEALRAAVEARRVRYGNQNLGVTISSGIACFPADGEDLTSMIKRADQALYAAKAGGRNCVVAASDVEEDAPELRGEEEDGRVGARVV
ncbi:MAG: diguanylate cyclase [Pseudomonadota bacterium]